MKEKLAENRKKILIAAIILILLIVAVVISVIALNGSGEDKENAIDIKAVSADINSQMEEAELTEEELEEVKSVEAEMEKELAAAGSEDEKKKIVEKYTEKIKDVSGGKVSVSAVKDTSKTDKTATNQTEDKNSTSDNNSSSSGSSDNSSSSSSNSGSSGNSSSSSGNSGNTSSTDNPSGGNESGSGGNKNPSHTHIAKGDMGWADSPDEIRRIYNNAYSAWKAKVEKGDTTSPEPINYSYKKCGCGKYTGTFVYGNPHSHIAVGNTGKWFNSQAEAEAYYDSIVAKFDNDVMNGTITPEYYDSHVPFGWSAPQCMCGKYTLNIKYPN